MKRLILSLSLLCGSVLGMNAQLLYKVSKDSADQKPSYIVASCKLMNPMGTISQVGGLKKALTDTDQMYFEVNKSAYANTLGEAKKLADNPAQCFPQEVHGGGLPQFLRAEKVW